MANRKLIEYHPHDKSILALVIKAYNLYLLNPYLYTLITQSNYIFVYEGRYNNEKTFERKRRILS